MSSTYYLGTSPSEALGDSPQFFYGLRRNSDGELFFVRSDQLRDLDDVEINTPGSISETFEDFQAGIDFLDGIDITHELVYENLKFQPNSFETLLNLVDEFNGLTLIPELYYLDLPLAKKEKVSDFKSPFPVREISLVYHRPFAKLRLINALSIEIRNIILPFLQTSKLKNKDMQIAKI
jgi:hypothetical protein